MSLQLKAHDVVCVASAKIVAFRNLLAIVDSRLTRTRVLDRPAAAKP